MSKVLLGFTVPEGEPFYIPRAHVVITGMTQLSGKSTTAEAIVRRSKETKALVFLTKRGEKTFFEGNRIQPYYRERFDWEYVRGLLEASMKERLKFETPWIIRVSKQARKELRLTHPEDPKLEHLELGEGLQMVRTLLFNGLQKEKMRDFDRNINTLLLAYIDKVLPVFLASKAKIADRLELKPGINVMDLTQWYTHEEVQMLVIRSCMEYILEKGNNVTVVLPEAWKMLPQSRNTPVKLYFEKFIREGATNGNYLLIDAQDLGGVDKTPLRQVSVWIMGKMMETNEVERLIKQTLGLKVPAREMQTLPLGHFIVACEDKVKKVYTCPWGIPEDIAIAVAKGSLPPERVKETLQEKRKNATRHIDVLSGDYQERIDAAVARIAEIEKHLEATNTRIEALVKTMGRYVTEDALHLVIHAFETVIKDVTNDIEKLRVEVHVRGDTVSPRAGPVELQKTLLEVHVTEHTKTFKLSDQTVQGKIMWLAKTGFFNSWKSEGEITKALTERGWTLVRITVYKALDKLVKEFFMGKRKTDRLQWKLGPNVRFIE